MSNPLPHEPIIRERPPVRAPGRSRQFHLALFVLVALILLVLVPWYLLKPKEERYRLRSYTYSAVQARDLRELVPASGVVLPGRKADVLALTAGTLADVAVKAGDDVGEGQVLGHIAAPDAEREVVEARRKLMEAEAGQHRVELDGRMSLRRAERELVDAEAHLASTQRLFEAGVVARNDLEKAELRVEEAGLALDVARERALMDRTDAAKAAELARETLRKREEILAGTVLKAPIAGRVLAVNAVAGQTVQTNAVIFTLADVKNLSVQAQVDEASATRVAAGQRADIAAGDGRFRGMVARVAPQATVGQGGGGGMPAVEVEIAFDEPPRGVLPNSSAAVSIEVGLRKGAATLPRGPYLTTGEQRFVYVIDGQKAVRRDVTFGLMDGNHIEIRGVEPGEKVITSSYEDFKDLAGVELSPGGGRPQ